MTGIVIDGKAHAPRRWFAATGAFSAFTLCWILIGLVGGGDFFGQGKAIAFVALAASAVGGAVSGVRAISR